MTNDIFGIWNSRAPESPGNLTISRILNSRNLTRQSASPAAWGAATSAAGPGPASPSGWRAWRARWRRWSWTAGRGSSRGTPKRCFKSYICRKVEIFKGAPTCQKIVAILKNKFRPSWSINKIGYFYLFFFLKRFFGLLGPGATILTAEIFLVLTQLNVPYRALLLCQLCHNPWDIPNPKQWSPSNWKFLPVAFLGRQKSVRICIRIFPDLICWGWCRPTNRQQRNVFVGLLKMPPLISICTSSPRTLEAQLRIKQQTEEQWRN